MSIEIARKLLGSGVVSRDELEKALLTHARTGTPLLRVMIDAGALSHRVLEEELTRLDAPTVRSVLPVMKLMDLLPPRFCRQLQAIPVRLDPRTGTIEVAAVDPLGGHVRTEMAFHLHAPVRVIRAPLAAIEEALNRLERGPSSPDIRPSSRPPPPSAPPPRKTHRTPPYLTRAELEPPQATSAVPQIRRHNSDMPIPLVRRAASTPGTVRPPIDQTITEALTRRASSPDLQATSLPPTRPGVMSMRVPKMPLPSAAPVMEAIRMAETRAEAIDLLINGLAMVAARVGILAVRKAAFRGYRCNEAFGDNATFSNVSIPIDVPSILATSAAAGYYLGPIPETPIHADLLKVMGGVAHEVSATPVRLEGLLVLVILLDGLADSMLATKRAEDLARVTSIALGAILHAGR